jgi:hypothetical protein
MIEALFDTKTWLFALFFAFDNVPNSLTNQRQIIVSSFGFTPLQTTLLGCVDGVIEIVTIWTGVNLAARLPNSRCALSSLVFPPATTLDNWYAQGVRGRSIFRTQFVGHDPNDILAMGEQSRPTVLVLVDW